ncbi:MAG: DUF423 domain-containing protein [Eudoraea sp.]|uniref:DUF423 domain-containing protein n=1 Tax=Eudoraea sp. TaxID=1979955 RepID=UPI003C74F944
MNKTIFLTGIILGGSAVLLGAFGSHTLKELLNEEALETFKIGTTYQMYHALFLLILSGITKIQKSALEKVYFFMITGVLLFSCSLYFISMKEIHGFEISYFGIITPLGGLLMIIAWLLLGYYGFTQLEGATPNK